MNVTEQFNEVQGIFETDLKVQHHFSDGVYAKQMQIPKGFTAFSHKHNYSHLSLLSKGKVVVTTDIGQKTYEAPACINIAAGMNHKIFALDDVVWYCIHATKETDPDKVDEVLIGKE